MNDRQVAFDHRWRWRRTRYGLLAEGLADRCGEPCRVVARGRDGKVLVEFGDGYVVAAPRHAVRRDPAVPKRPGGPRQPRRVG